LRLTVKSYRFGCSIGINCREMESV
jgi:hypothetical protein